MIMRRALVFALAFAFSAAYAQTGSLGSPSQAPQVVVQPVQTPTITNAPADPRLLQLVPADPVARASRPEDSVKNGERDAAPEKNDFQDFIPRGGTRGRGPAQRLAEVRRGPSRSRSCVDAFSPFALPSGSTP